MLVLNGPGPSQDLSLWIRRWNRRVCRPTGCRTTQKDLESLGCLRRLSITTDLFRLQVNRSRKIKVLQADRRQIDSSCCIWCRVCFCCEAYPSGWALLAAWHRLLRVCGVGSAGSENQHPERMHPKQKAEASAASRLIASTSSIGQLRSRPRRTSARPANDITRLSERGLDRICEEQGMKLSKLPPKRYPPACTCRLFLAS